MDEIKQVIAYKATDGFTNENEKEVIEHQKEVSLRKIFSDFVEAHGWRGMGKDDVADMLFENRVQLIDSIAEVKK